MSGPLKLWPVAVQNPVTKEWIRFLGQGYGVVDAVKDGLETLQAPFRPDSSGNVKPSIGLGVAGKVAVKTVDGRTVVRSLKDFESELPYGEAKEAS